MDIGKKLRTLEVELEPAAPKMPAVPAEPNPKQQPAEPVPADR